MDTPALPSVLVTGATGFVGSRLVRRLADAAASVHVLARPDSNLDQIAGVVDRLYIHRWDGTIDSLDSIFQKARPEIVFHVASLFLAAHKPADVPRLIRSNVEFGAMLLEAATAAGVTRVINTGTSWEHFENAPWRAVNLYAATKHAFEGILDYYCDAHGLRAITLKLFDTYGPGDPRPKLMSILGRAAREQKPLDMSPGEQLLDLLYIDDVTHAFLIAAQRTATLPQGANERFALGSGQRVTLKQLVELMAYTLHIDIPVHFGTRPYRPREVMIPWTAGIPLPGWTPTTALAEGLRKCFAHDAARSGT